MDWLELSKNPKKNMLYISEYEFRKMLSKAEKDGRRQLIIEEKLKKMLGKVKK